MSKKNIKTIALIVFLVIVVIYPNKNVRAEEKKAIKSTTCYYPFNTKDGQDEPSDNYGYTTTGSWGNIRVKISMSGSANAIFEMDYEFPENMSKAEKTFVGDGEYILHFFEKDDVFSGYNYYKNGGKFECPPAIYYMAFDLKGVSNVVNILDELPLLKDWFKGYSRGKGIAFYDGTSSMKSKVKKELHNKLAPKCGDNTDGIELPFIGKIRYGYFTDCLDLKVDNSLTKHEYVEVEDPEPPEPEECEINPEACEDPGVNSNIVKPIVPASTSTYSCGHGMMTGMNGTILKVTNYSYNILRIIVPIALVIMGSIDLVKGIIAQKDDEIKKGQQIFVKRLIAALLIFFVFAIVKLLIGIFAKGKSSDIVECLDCFIEGKGSQSCVVER